MFNKYRVLHVNLTIDEYDKYKLHISDIGETLSRFTRKLVRETINGEIDLLMDERSGFKLALRQLIGMAYNLNQLTKTIHSGIFTPNLDMNYLKDIQKHVMDFRSELLRIIQRTNKRAVKWND